MSEVTDVRVVDREEAAGLPELSDELRMALTGIAGVAREGCWLSEPSLAGAVVGAGQWLAGRLASRRDPGSTGGQRVGRGRMRRRSGSRWAWQTAWR